MWSRPARAARAYTSGSFKGFLQQTATGWAATPGLDNAPPTVPEWMAVIIATSITKNGPLIAATTTHTVVVHVDSYDPAELGRATIVENTS